MKVTRQTDQVTAMVVAPSLGGGGAEKATLLIADGLQRLGIYTHLVVEKASDAPLFPVPPVAQVHELRSPSTARSVVPLSKLIRAHRPDFVYTALPHVNILGAISAIASGRGTRLIVSVHNNLSEEFRGLDDAGKLRMLTPWTYRRAFRVIAVSRGVASSIVSHGSVGEKTRVVPNPVDDSCFTYDATVRQQSISSRARTAPRIISIGRLVPQKNFNLLIDAFSHFLNEFPDATLTILGEGPLRSPLEEHVRKLGLADAISMPGLHPNPSDILRGCDLYVQTSDFEGFGLAILEAMAAGLPCVSTDCDYGPRELIQNGRSGFLTESDPIRIAAAMAEALRSPERSLQLGSQGYEISKSFSVDHVSRAIAHAALESPADRGAQG
jgi:glycosyltransferase involved in cell wall biosynthesis